MKTTFKTLAQRGFTLIELIITIVIIGVLAAVAIPKFLDLTNDAEKGVAAGVGAALASGTSVNYGRFKVPGYTVCTALNTPAGCVPPITTCGVLDTYKTQLADIPALYVVSGGALANTGLVGSCTLTSPNGAIVTFNAYGSS